MSVTTIRWGRCTAAFTADIAEAAMGFVYPATLAEGETFTTISKAASVR